MNNPYKRELEPQEKMYVDFLLKHSYQPDNINLNYVGQPGNREGLRKRKITINELDIYTRVTRKRRDECQDYKDRDYRLLIDSELFEIIVKISPNKEKFLAELKTLESLISTLV